MSRKVYNSMRDVEKFEARQFREAGMSVKDCARYFNVSVATLMRGLAEMRERFGPEQYRRHPVRRAIENPESLSAEK